MDSLWKEGPSFTFSEDRRTVSFDYSFNRWDFEIGGQIPVWTLCDRADWLSFLAVAALDANLARPDMRVFTRCQVWEISPSFYSVVRPGRPLKVSSRVVYVGNTSFVKKGEIVDRSTNEILVKGMVQDVLISMDTRRPTPFPDWLKENYLHLTSEPRPEMAEVFEKPPAAKTFVYSVTVPPSDIDLNNHTNQRHYIRYCFDCAVVGARQGAYPTVRGDVLKQGVRKVSVLYQKESLEGDVLSVDSWEESPGTLRFQVRKVYENLVQVTLQFHETNKSKL
ncbi:PREDICTED: uncharacterized protein LOC109461594 [Branchiostoma belcheri]|uniref:Uncharacterized protein LOC109461594 n=1 Tax=Branchiostoma belcheri TaxID=7741 RepID=A0A6P4XS46_BRABE|nr:PREDICTED: uncharacterized protein LOC109461594 [Branchiostoma belcheri]